MYAQYHGAMQFFLTFPDRSAQQGACGEHGALGMIGCLIQEDEKASILRLCQRICACLSGSRDLQLDWEKGIDISEVKASGKYFHLGVSGAAVTLLQVLQVPGSIP